MLINQDDIAMIVPHKFYLTYRTAKEWFMVKYGKLNFSNGVFDVEIQGVLTHGEMKGEKAEVLSGQED